MSSIITGESSPSFYENPTGITLGGRVKDYATIQDMLNDKSPSKFARVADATGDTTVKSGAAVYRRQGTDWVKVYEEESMDIENVITWDTLKGAPDVTAEQVKSAVSNSHSHSNAATLDALGTNQAGNLTLNGVQVGSGSAEVSNLASRVDAHDTAIAALQAIDPVLSVNGSTPDSNGAVTITVPADVSDLTDTTNIISGKQDAITGSQGQFVKIGDNGKPVAETVDLSSFGSVKSVNNILPDNSGNITIDVGTGDVTAAQFNELTDRVTDVEEQMLTKATDYTAWEVYANDVEIPVGESNELGGYVTNAIPAQMTEKFLLRGNKLQANMDVVVDWGDGNISSIKDNEGIESISDSNFADYTLCDYVMSHTYENPGKYIIKIFGKDYTGIRHNTYPANNLMCRCLSSDLPIASHWFNLSNFARGALRLLKVQIPWNFKLPNFINLGNTFMDCSNLLSATGFDDWNALPDFGYSVSSTFRNCGAMTTTDFVLPIGFSGGVGATFGYCRSLVRNIEDFFTASGNQGYKKRFLNKEMRPDILFGGCASLTGTIPADILWEDTTINWTTSTNTFAGCAPEIRAQAPTSWGGTNTEIQEKLNSGYYKQLRKSDIITTPVDQGSVSSASYVADYTNGDVQMITLTENTTISASNIPVGEGMMVRVNNNEGVSVVVNGTEVISEEGNYYLSFVNMTGTIELLGGATKVM